MHFQQNQIIKPVVLKKMSIPKLEKKVLYIIMLRKWVWSEEIVTSFEVHTKKWDNVPSSLVFDLENNALFQHL